MTVVATYFTDEYSAIVADCKVKDGSSGPVDRIQSKLAVNNDSSVYLAFSGSEIVHMAVNCLLVWSQDHNASVDFSDRRFLINVIDCANHLIGAYKNKGIGPYASDSIIHFASSEGVYSWRPRFGETKQEFWYAGTENPIPHRSSGIEIFYGSQFDEIDNPIKEPSDEKSVFEAVKLKIETYHKMKKEKKDPLVLDYDFDGYFSGVVFNRTTKKKTYFPHYGSVSELIFGEIGGAKNLALMKSTGGTWVPKL